MPMKVSDILRLKGNTLYTLTPEHTLWAAVQPMAEHDIGSVVVSGSKIMMQQPRLAGFTKDNRRYDLTAQAAGQDLTKPDMVELQGIRATLELQDDATFETTARNGLYNTKTELLTLSNNIVVTSTNGYEAFLSEAVLDMHAGDFGADERGIFKELRPCEGAKHAEAVGEAVLHLGEQSVISVRAQRKIALGDHTEKRISGKQTIQGCGLAAAN